MIIQGDAISSLKTLASGSINCCVTSPPYFGLRDYGHDGQFGLEKTPEAYVQSLVEVFREVHRVLRDDGTLWLNIGDSYARTGETDKKQSKAAIVGSTKNTLVQIADRKQKTPSGLKEKDLIGIPWRIAFALQADGWYLRQDIIWHKPNVMPESVKDRCTKSHEYIFLLSKSPRYYFDAEAIKETAIQAGRVRADRMGGNKYVEGIKHSNGSVFTGSDTRNRRSVWSVNTKPFKGAHFAVFPTALIEPCVLAGCPQDGVVLDPFLGSGTTGLVAQNLGRKWVGIELNPEYAAMAAERTGLLLDAAQ